ncbi:MAG: pyridoxal phosphate-dependent aminotransferase, partial [Gammaproteobacteria bacterium]|nr:pyridoxal phosphate-dependent aminotransferase [Gammaproteobacteria bacterium]
MSQKNGHLHNPLISGKVLDLRLSAIKEMAMLCARVEGAVSLSWGLPSFNTPEYIRSGIEQALREDEDIGRYTLPDGLAALRKVVAEKHLEDTGVTVSPDENVLITAGNMQAMTTLFRTIIDPDDEIILTDPCFPSHVQQIQLSGGKPVYWPLDEQNDWALDTGILADLINKKTRAIVIVSPSNPTGKIFDRQTLTRTVELARQHGVFLIIDDPYHHFIHENKDRYFNPASIKEMFDNIIYCYSFSKAYAMSGWRIGYMVVPEHLKREALKVQD